MSKNKNGFYVYSYISDGKIVYVGQTTDPYVRIRQHGCFTGLDEKFAQYGGKATILIHECSTKREMDALEHLLIHAYKPVTGAKPRPLSGARWKIARIRTDIREVEYERDRAYRAMAALREIRYMKGMTTFECCDADFILEASGALRGYTVASDDSHEELRLAPRATATRDRTRCTLYVNSDDVEKFLSVYDDEIEFFEREIAGLEAKISELEKSA